jgi:hypothetical protein
MPFIASTLACDNRYALFSDNPSGARQTLKSVLIRGGAGVASQPHALANGVLTPHGIVTSVTDEELELLQSNVHFQGHLSGGFLKIMKSEVKPEKAAADMNKKDESRPLDESDTKEGGRLSGAKQHEKKK